MKIVVNTPAGNIGRVVAEALLDAGEQPVLISRHPAKIAELLRRGATLVQGSLDEPAVLQQAMRGADALFWLTPFGFDQPDYIEWAEQAGRLAAGIAHGLGVRRGVVISSQGAQHATGVGPIGCLPVIERAFREALPDLTLLRPGSFMENFLTDIASIAADGTVYGPRPTVVPVAYVATRDIAGQAVAALLRPSPAEGTRIQGVHGPEDLTPVEAAHIIGRGIERPVRYVEISVEQSKQAMHRAGMPDSVVELLGDLHAGYRTGRVRPAEPRSPETTTPTTLLEFSRQVLKPAVDATLARRA